MLKEHFNVFPMFKKIILIFIVLGVAAGIAYVLVRPEPQPEYTTHRVERGLLQQTVDATGKIESTERIDLNFRITGRIASISARAGDVVTQGQELARLDAGALESKLADARATLSKAQADYAQLLAGASDSEVRVAENKVSEKEQALTNANNMYRNLLTLRDSELFNLKETALTVLNNELSTAQGALTEVGNVLGDEGTSPTFAGRDRDTLTE